MACPFFLCSVCDTPLSLRDISLKVRNETDTPLSLRDISFKSFVMRPTPLYRFATSPQRGEKLLPFMEFLPPPVGVAEEPALQSGAEGGNKISKNT